MKRLAITALIFLTLFTLAASECIPGDLNYDKVINDTDLQIFKTEIVDNNFELGSISKECADYNRDGEVDKNDYICINFFLSGQLDDYEFFGCPSLEPKVEQPGDYCYFIYEGNDSWATGKLGDVWQDPDSPQNYEGIKAAFWQEGVLWVIDDKNYYIYDPNLPTGKRWSKHGPLSKEWGGDMDGPIDYSDIKAAFELNGKPNIVDSLFYYSYEGDDKWTIKELSDIWVDPDAPQDYGDITSAFWFKNKVIVLDSREYHIFNPKAGKPLPAQKGKGSKIHKEGKWIVHGDLSKQWGDNENAPTDYASIKAAFELDGKPHIIAKCLNGSMPMECVDTDGFNITQKGYASGTTLTGNYNMDAEDYCYLAEEGNMVSNCSGEGCMLAEWYCENTTKDGILSTEYIKCPDGCKDGACLEAPPAVNIKDMSKYSDKQAFLLSDSDWRKVLTLVPVTTWTQQDGDTSQCQKGYGTAEGVCVYPTLIYHEEDGGFDADSIIYFMQQYNPTSLFIIGDTPKELDNLLIAQPELGAGIQEDQIDRKYSTDYLSYWDDYKNVVYVKNDYELALLASTYASLLNAPLIIQNYNDDVDLSNRNVICVGINNDFCDQEYTPELLRKEYVKKTNTDKIILVNPNDLNIKVNEVFHPEKSGNPINEIYSKTSLASPILASAKHELILSTKATDYVGIDSFIENKINTLNLEAEYLTIIASPDAIQMSALGDLERSASSFYSVDAWDYPLIDDDQFLDLAVGRIFGITISDISSNVQRSLFYDNILANEENILVTRGSPCVVSAAEIYAIGKVLESIGYNVQITAERTFPDDWKNKFFIAYLDHGGKNWAGINSVDIPYLDNTFIFASACLTCDYSESSSKRALFCSNAIRKGAVGYIGGVDISSSPNVGDFIDGIFAQEEDLGTAFKNFKNSRLLFNEFINLDSDPQYTLIGDPTLKPKTIHKLPKPRYDSLATKDGELLIKATLPTMEIELPTNVLDLCEYPGFLAKNSIDFTTTFKALLYPDNLYPPSVAIRFRNPDSFFPVATTSKRWVIKRELGGSHFWLYNKTTIGIFDNIPKTGFTDVVFELGLLNKAPDFSVENVVFDKENRKTTFDVINSGNTIGEAVANGYIQLDYTRLEGEYNYQEYFENQFMEGANIKLLPNEKRTFSFIWPTIDSGGRSFYVDGPGIWAIEIDLRVSDSLIQQDYDNDVWKGEFK